MGETRIESIRVSLVTQQRVVILRDINRERYLPIWIGPYEADAIAQELQQVPFSRPLTHDLMKNIIAELGGQVTHILISELQEEVYHARVVMDVSGRHVEVDSRSSDAIALAVRVHAPIMVDDGVMDRASMTIDGSPINDEDRLADDIGIGGTTELSATDLSVFRDFINSLDIDDLGDRNSLKVSVRILKQKERPTGPSFLILAIICYAYG
jgi:uncharacterized protein